MEGEAETGDCDVPYAVHVGLDTAAAVPGYPERWS